jgi:hypothetical protein
MDALSLETANVFKALAVAGERNWSFVSLQLHPSP